MKSIGDTRQCGFGFREAAAPACAGTPLGDDRFIDKGRKVISVILANLMGSTALQERLDPESVNPVMDAYYQTVRGPVEAAGGTVVQLLGDGSCARSGG